MRQYAACFKLTSKQKIFGCHLFFKKRYDMLQSHDTLLNCAMFFLWYHQFKIIHFNSFERAVSSRSIILAGKPSLQKTADGFQCFALLADTVHRSTVIFEAAFWPDVLVPSWPDFRRLFLWMTGMGVKLDFLMCLIGIHPDRTPNTLTSLPPKKPMISQKLKSNGYRIIMRKNDEIKLYTYAIKRFKKCQTFKK